MNVRLRRLVAVSCFGLSAAIAACGGSTGPSGSGASSSVSGEYKGELSGPGLTGVLDVTFGSGSSATSATRVLDTQDEETATGTLTLSGGATFQLSGSFDPDTKALSIAGGGYAFSGTLDGDGFTGTYTSPSGSGSFTLVKGGSAKVFCGAYAGQDTGVWNLVVGASSAAGSLANDRGTVSSALTCSVNGASLSCQTSGGMVVDGTIGGSTCSGEWHDGHGNGGTWSGDVGKCPVPVPPPDAGEAPDATTTTLDAGEADASTAADAGSSAPDAAAPADSSGAQDTGAAVDSALPTDAGTVADVVSQGVDAATGVNASAGADAGGDSAAPVDAGTSADASTPPTDAASCGTVANVTSVTTVGGPHPTAITSLGMGTGNYPIQILTNAAICPGATVVQIYPPNSPWTDLGTCQGSGADTTCDGLVIPAADLSFPAQVQLRVVNPGQAAGTAYSFYVFQGSPSPVITGPATGSLVAGGGAQNITLAGTGFTGATVECDFTGGDGGVAVVPAILQQTSTFMTIQFPASFTATAQPPFWTKVTVATQPGGVAYWAVQIDVP